MENITTELNELKASIQATYIELKGITQRTDRLEAQEEINDGLKRIYAIVKKTVFHQLIGLQKIALKLDNEAKIKQLDKEINQIEDKENSYELEGLTKNLKFLADKNSKLVSENKSLKGIIHKINEGCEKKKENLDPSRVAQTSNTKPRMSDYNNDTDVNQASKSATSLDTICDNECGIQASKYLKYMPSINASDNSTKGGKTAKNHDQKRGASRNRFCSQADSTKIEAKKTRKKSCNNFSVKGTSKSKFKRKDRFSPTNDVSMTTKVIRIEDLDKSINVLHSCINKSKNNYRSRDKKRYRHNEPNYSNYISCKNPVKSSTSLNTTALKENRQGSRMYHKLSCNRKMYESLEELKTGHTSLIDCKKPEGPKRSDVFRSKKLTLQDDEYNCSNNESKYTPLSHMGGSVRPTSLQKKRDERKLLKKQLANE
ncbi:unnamed protein product [Moneuplotes crassus]|uniref:Uncharacterized protein n=1 Tax=Euplotes crassus TaxID=5936 RepID=A0AAD1UD37_EUPCR|nr:unnamed protein product [Moneuplotes crassus]